MRIGNIPGFLLFLAAMYGFGAVVDACAMRYVHANRTRLLTTRPVLSLGEIYNQFYLDSEVSRDAFERVWRQVTETLHVNPGKLRADDRLIDRCGWPKWVSTWDGDTDDLISLVEIKPDSRPAEELGPFETIDNVARYLAAP